VVGYAYLVGIVNYRYIRVAKGLLQVIKGPLPQTDNKIDIDVNDIEEVYCDYEISRTGHDQNELISIVVGIKEESDVENDIILLFTNTYEEAQAITDTLNELLNMN